MLGATIAILAGLVLVSIGLSIVAFQRLAPLIFHCVRCGRDFEQRPYRPFPRACPRCGARDWPV